MAVSGAEKDRTGLSPYLVNCNFGLTQRELRCCSPGCGMRLITQRTLKRGHTGSMAGQGVLDPG